MKAERKHELKHNDLDDILGRVTHFLRENGVVLAIGAAVVVLVILTYAIFVRTGDISDPAGKWNDYFYALSDDSALEELQKFVDANPNSTEAPVLWAKLSLADLKFARAARDLFTDRKAAETTLAEAEKLYADVEKAGPRTLLRDRARIGLAKVYESQNKPEEALRYYDMVLSSTGADSPQGKMAERGKRRLSNPANLEFLAWFEQQQPAPRRTGGIPFDHGQGPDGFPELPGFGLPGLFDGAGPELDLPGTRPPGASTPPPRPTPPAGDAGEEPIDDNPLRFDPSDDTPPAPEQPGDMDDAPPVIDPVDDSVDPAPAQPE
jgi:predicted negative regulator of RcsB-dependent stress response